MRTLMDPLTPEERILLHTVWEPFAKEGQFPTLRYVNYVLRRQGLDAAAILRSVPVAQMSDWNAGYRAVFSDRDGYPRPDGEVRLTIAGLYHLRGDETADGICRILLETMRAASKAQEYILSNPYVTTDAEASFAKVLDRIEASDELAKRAELIAAAEWPGLRISSQDANARIEAVQPGHLLPDADFASVEEYLAAITVATTPLPIPQPLPYGDPRALLRAFSVLDVTVELVLGIAGFAARPPVDRSALLALDVDDDHSLQTGITVLTEMLANLQVGKAQGHPSPHALGRLTNWLTQELPTINQPAVARANATLDSLREIRNSTIHPKPNGKHLKNHEKLGLSYPITDPSRAWDSIRAHTEQALITLYEEILAARPAAQ
ncbi:hypothetical protein ACIOGZ_29795 [Kitasatospora sp. NPDC088160]|uniref:hypothetical protein n=1 Tax=Kitasatospora sp. NPDC088160 TaxID=3364072 RepID=UPI00380F2F4B